jgi:ADP-ribosylglycohydrolase
MSVDINKAVGCLVGLAAGDRNGGPTQMMLELCDSLIANNGRVDVDDIGKRYLDWYNNNGHDTGRVTARTFDYVNKGMTFKAASKQADVELYNMTAGVRPAHRSAPLGVLLAKKYSTITTETAINERIRFRLNKGVANFINDEAELTHSHPIAGDISKATNIIIMCLILGLEFEDAVAHSLGAIDWSNVRNDLISKELKRSELMDSGYSPSVLIAAVWFLRNTNSFEEALTESIKFAGVANYCPVLVGSIGGAMYGVDAIPSSCTEHLGGLYDSTYSLEAVVRVKANRLAWLQLPQLPHKKLYTPTKHYPENIKNLMVSVNKFIEFTKNSDMHLISESIEDAHKYKKDFEKLNPFKQREILSDFDVFDNHISISKSYKLLKKNFNLPDYSELGFSNDSTGGITDSSSYQSIHYRHKEYLKYLDTEDIVHLITGLIEAENQVLYFTGSTNQIYHMFFALMEREYEGLYELEQWAWYYADNCYVPTGSCGRIRGISHSVADYHQRWDDFECNRIQGQLDKIERIKRQRKENEAKQVKMRERQTKNSVYRDELIKQLEYFAPYEKLIVISGNGMGMPPYYFPIYLVDNITDEEIKKIPEDVKQQMISRIQHFDFDKLHNRTTKMMRPWYEFSYRLTGERPKPKYRKLVKERKIDKEKIISTLIKTYRLMGKRPEPKYRKLVKEKKIDKEIIISTLIKTGVAKKATVALFAKLMPNSKSVAEYIPPETDTKEMSTYKLGKEYESKLPYVKMKFRYWGYK